MLLNAKHLDGIANGKIKLAFRKWKKPTVKTGGRLRTRIGVLAIKAVDLILKRFKTEAFRSSDDNDSEFN